MIHPYTKDDLKRGTEIVMELHGLKGFDAWAERIAKELAAERERSQTHSNGVRQSDG